MALKSAQIFTRCGRTRALASRRSLLAWALCSLLALLTHYFAVFLMAPEAALLLRGRLRDRHTLAAVAGVAVGGAALIPLIVAQGGRGTSWILNWRLGARLP